MKDPYLHEIRVTWGDCDPAKIAYTARIPAWALDAINGFWEHVLDGDGWYQMELDRGYGSPFVHMSLDFSSPVTPRHRLICAVRPVRLGTKSIEFSVKGSQDGRACFEGRFVCVFTNAADFTSRVAPDEVRAAVEPYLAG